MKKLSVILVAMFLATGAGAQNTFPTTGKVGIGTTTPSALLEVSSQTPAIDGVRLSGLEFIWGQTSTDGIAMRLGINRPSNRQLWIADSAAAINTTNPQIRFWLGNGASFAGVDSISTDGTTYTSLVLNSGGGNVGLGTTTPMEKLDVSGNIKLSPIPGSTSGGHIAFPDGSIQSVAWTGSLCGGDYAESVDVSGSRTDYEPGDVLVLDPTHPGSFLKSNGRYSRLVAGIYSTKPGVVGRRQTTDPKLTASEVPMAMVGIVPTKVTSENGPIEVGDLLVSSSLPAHAMKGSDDAMKTGTVIGKALGNLPGGTGIIEVLVSLQ